MSRVKTEYRQRQENREYVRDKYGESKPLLGRVVTEHGAFRPYGYRPPKEAINDGSSHYLGLYCTIYVDSNKEESDHHMYDGNGYSRGDGSGRGRTESDGEGLLDGQSSYESWNEHPIVRRDGKMCVFGRYAKNMGVLLLRYQDE